MYIALSQKENHKLRIFEHKIEKMTNFDFVRREPNDAKKKKENKKIDELNEINKYEENVIVIE